MVCICFFLMFFFPPRYKHTHIYIYIHIPSLKLTVCTCKSGKLVWKIVVFGGKVRLFFFSGAFAVSFREGMYNIWILYIP